MNVEFFITDSAAKRIAEILMTQGGDGFRVEVLGGGCSGFQYNFDYKSKPCPEDMIFEHNGVKVFIDDISMKFLNGAKLNYHVDLSGAMFEVINPNASSKCGCKNSFSI